jgi:hypothetical protein
MSPLLAGRALNISKWNLTAEEAEKLLVRDEEGASPHG